jgi:hypothetical protein
MPSPAVAGTRREWAREVVARCTIAFFAQQATLWEIILEWEAGDIPSQVISVQT